MAEVKRADVLSYLESSNMVEISELISDIEEKFGVTAAAPVALPPQPQQQVTLAPPKKKIHSMSLLLK